jgi:dTDP-4-dehydrorhamnose reductase
MIDIPLVLGSKGFLGTHFATYLQEKASRNLSEKNSQKLSLSETKFFNSEDVFSLIRNTECHTVINCVAIADIETCESNTELAKWVNADLPRIMAEACEKSSKKFIHFSTDAVFDGKSSNVEETHLPSPLSVYGTTKLEGEKYVIKSCENSQVYRVNFFGINPKGKSLYDFFRKAAEMEQIVPGYHNLYFTPIFVGHLVQIISEHHTALAPGIYHAVGSERISKFQFGQKIFESLGKDISLVLPTSVDASSPTGHRSTDLSLSNAKLLANGIRIPSYRIGLDLLGKELYTGGKRE